MLNRLLLWSTSQKVFPFKKKKSFYKIKLIVFLPRPAGTRLGQCLVILSALSCI